MKQNNGLTWFVQLAVFEQILAGITIFHYWTPQNIEAYITQCLQNQLKHLDGTFDEKKNFPQRIGEPKGQQQQESQG